MATIFYATTGSNTAASGTNAPTTAVTAGTVSVTSGNATITLSATRDLTGVLNNGEDVVWVNTSTTNRHLFRVTSFTGGVATCTALVCAETSTVTASGLSWAIGGAARLSLDADTGRPDIEDASAGWILELQGTGVTYTLTAASLPLVTTGGSIARGPVILRGASGATVTINCATSGNMIAPAASNLLELRNFTLTNTGGGGANLIQIVNDDMQLKIIDCTIGGAASSAGAAVHVNGGQCRIVCINSTFTGSTSSGFNFTASGLHFSFIACIFRNNATNGFAIDNNLALGTIDGCIFRDNTSDGIQLSVASAYRTITIKNCVFHGNTASGIDVVDTGLLFACHTVIMNCIFTDNGAYGLDANTTAVYSDMTFFADYNAYRNNTSGARNLITAGAHDVTLTADPYTNEAGNDFSLNTTAGGGAACTDTGFGRTT